MAEWASPPLLQMMQGRAVRMEWALEKARTPVSELDAVNCPLFAAYALRCAAALENAEEARDRCALAAFAFDYLADEAEMARTTYKTSAPFHMWASEIINNPHPPSRARTALPISIKSAKRSRKTACNPNEQSHIIGARLAKQSRADNDDSR